MREVIVRTEPLGGSPLARLAIDGVVLATWYGLRPRTTDEWRARVEATRAEFAGTDWWQTIAPALAAEGAAAARLGRVRSENGVLVTTGQQPGLFGGPVYGWSKALSALALADEVERTLGVAAAPVFWAATDDADFAEASWTAVAVPGGAQRLVAEAGAPLGAPLSQVPYASTARELEALVRACGATVDDRPLAALRAAYTDGRTVGDAYVALLRILLQPLGIAVLDASHAAVVRAARPVLTRALQEARPIAGALQARDAEIRAAGFTPQVSEVSGLSLVFERSQAAGEKRRVSLEAAERVAASHAGERLLSPNVLLRPVVERAIVPTVAYAAGPGELAYFAQVSAVASAIGAAQPLAVPRWSGTIIEPNIARILERLDLAVEDLRDPHAAEGRLARDAVPSDVARALAELRGELDRRLKALEEAVSTAASLVPATVVGGAGGSLARRLDRLDRRITAAVKRREHEVMTQVATARGALFPFGVRQERALNAIPFFARHGATVIERMLVAARAHAARLVAPARQADGAHRLDSTGVDIVGQSTLDRGTADAPAT